MQFYGPPQFFGPDSKGCNFELNSWFLCLFCLAFDVFLERMPEGCNVVLNSYLKSNGKSTGAADFEITMNYAMFLRAHKHSPSK